MNLECVICYEAFQPVSDAIVTTCGHIFHEQCLRHWMVQSNTCPHCRRECSNLTIRKIYLNVTNSQTNPSGVESLRRQLDKANSDIKSGQDIQRELQKENSELEEKLCKTNFELNKKERSKDTLKGMVRALKTDIKTLTDYSADLNIQLRNLKQILKKVKLSDSEDEYADDDEDGVMPLHVRTQIYFNQKKIHSCFKFKS